MPNLEDFMTISAKLRFCPSCASLLEVDAENHAVKSCPKHGDIFCINQTITGYQVVTDLSGGATSGMVYG